MTAVREIALPARMLHVAFCCGFWCNGLGGGGRLTEEGIVKSILEADSGISQSDAKAMLKNWFVSAPMAESFNSKPEAGIVLDLTRTEDAPQWASDDAFLAWAKDSSSSLASNLKVSPYADHIFSFFGWTY